MTIIFVSASFRAFAGWGPPCDAQVTELPQTGQVVAIARCAYTFQNGQQNNAVTVRGQMKVSPSPFPNAAVAGCQASGYCGMSFSWSPYSANSSYSATADFTAAEHGLIFDQTTVSGGVLTQPPQRPREDPVPPWFDDDPGGCGYCDSPIILAIGDDRYRLTSADEGVWFDLATRGVPSRTAWTATGSDNAFLALDRNQNGRIDDGAELFGNHTPLRSGAVAANGFDALRELDANGDGMVDAADEDWHRLLLWIDENHDGVSSPAELRRMANSEVIALEVGYRPVGRQDRWGNEFRYQAHLRLRKEAAEQRRAYYDVFLVTAR